MTHDIAATRLANQLITRGGGRDPAAVVSWFGAMQAQEYPWARWGIGLRLGAGARDAAIERAFDEGRILRTHVMRPTWHFVTPADIRWLQELTGPRVQRAMATYMRQLDVDARMLSRGTDCITRALRDGACLTRRELAERLARTGIALAGTRLALLVMNAELEAVICSGPRRGKEFTYALLDARVPAAPRLTRDEALATLCRRFFASHGPATIRDFVWWSGLPTAEAKRALEMNRAASIQVDGLTYWTVRARPRGASRVRRVLLLPVYDEYLVAHRDRIAVPHGATTADSAVFQSPLVIDGQVAGTWSVRPQRDGLRLRVAAARPPGRRDRLALQDEIDRYARFAGARVEATISS